jgi:hypothetical protein
MNDMRDDDRFVAFLQQFQPRPPGPLRGDRRPRARVWLAAAAAGLLVVIGSTFWLSNRQGTNPALAPPMIDRRSAPSERADDTILRLGEAARLSEWDAVLLDQLLTDLSRGLMPPVERPESTLSVLAKP